MNKTRIIFQNNFSKVSEQAIKNWYNLTDDDKPLLAVWTGKMLGKTIRDRGFVFSKRGLTWYFPTVAVSGSTDENSERSQRDFDFLPKEITILRLHFLRSMELQKNFI